MKKNNGITLVALIITIIVMLILVAVTVSILINSNVIGKAKSAGKDTQTAYNNESNFGERITIGETEYNSIDEYMEELNTPQMSTLPAGTYTAGQEVTFGGEQFFVVADDGNSVRLLAKYCLNQEGTAQTDKDTTSAEYGRQFSNRMYWSSDPNGTECEDLLDLQTSEMIEKAQNNGTIIQSAVLTAIAYGEGKGVTGRLMTYDEAFAMITSSSEKMYGTWTDGTQPTQGYLSWWLGNAKEMTSENEGMPGVYTVRESWGGLTYNGYQWNEGVRPVLVVPES